MIKSYEEYAIKNTFVGESRIFGDDATDISLNDIIGKEFIRITYHHNNSIVLDIRSKKPITASNDGYDIMVDIDTPKTSTTMYVLNSDVKNVAFQDTTVYVFLKSGDWIEFIAPDSFILQQQ